MPEISVVIPAHDEEALIGGAVRSVLADATADVEVIVVLDRCRDQTAQRVADLHDGRARCIQSEGPPGIAGALNTGLRQSRSMLVARLDADDAQEPDRLRLQLSLLRAERLDICVGWARLVREDGSETMQSTPESSDAIRAGLRRANVIVHSSVLLDREKVLALGGYRNTRWEDYDLWVRCSRAGLRFGSVPAVVVTRRLRASGWGEQRGHSLAGRGAVLCLRFRAALATDRVLPW